MSWSSVSAGDLVKVAAGSAELDGIVFDNRSLQGHRRRRRPPSRTSVSDGQPEHPDGARRGGSDGPDIAAARSAGAPTGSRCDPRRNGRRATTLWLQARRGASPNRQGQRTVRSWRLRQWPAARPRAVAVLGGQLELEDGEVDLVAPGTLEPLVAQQTGFSPHPRRSARRSEASYEHPPWRSPGADELVECQVKQGVRCLSGIAAPE